MNSQRFQEYRCESGIALFAWRVSWNYPYSPFNIGWPCYSILINVLFFNTGVSYDSFPRVDESSVRQGSIDQPTAPVGEASSVL